MMLFYNHNMLVCIFPKVSNIVNVTQLMLSTFESTLAYKMASLLTDL